MKLKSAAWNQFDRSHTAIIKRQRIHLGQTGFPHFSLWKKTIGLLSSVLFLQLAQRWRCLCWLGGPESSGQDRACCRACATGARPGWAAAPVNSSSQKSWKCLSGASHYSICDEGWAPSYCNCQTPTVRRQGEERCSLVYCQSLSEIPHVLKTLPAVQWGIV